MSLPEYASIAKHNHIEQPEIYYYNNCFISFELNEFNQTGFKIIKNFVFDQFVLCPEPILQAYETGALTQSGKYFFDFISLKLLVKFPGFEGEKSPLTNQGKNLPNKELIEYFGLDYEEYVAQIEF